MRHKVGDLIAFRAYEDDFRELRVGQIIEPLRADRFWFTECHGPNAGRDWCCGIESNYLCSPSIGQRLIHPDATWVERDQT